MFSMHVSRFRFIRMYYYRFQMRRPVDTSAGSLRGVSGYLCMP